MSNTTTEVDTTTGEITNLSTAQLLEQSAWGHVVRAETAEQKYEAGRYALEPVRFSPWGLPIPRLADDLPWTTDNSQTVDAILVNLIAADDIEAATDGKELRKADAIAGLPVTVFDLRAHESEVQPDPKDADPTNWGFYVTLDVSVNSGPREAISCGAKQAIVILWRCWCEGRFPVDGTFRLLGKERGGRSRPIGFDVESKLG